MAKKIDRPWLAPPWKPGQSGNPSGRAPGVVYPAEYVRMMACMKQSELVKIHADENQPMARRIAAHQLIEALDAELSPADRERARSALMDRTTGRPAVEGQSGDDGDDGVTRDGNQIVVNIGTDQVFGRVRRLTEQMQSRSVIEATPRKASPRKAGGNGAQPSGNGKSKTGRARGGKAPPADPVSSD